MRAAVIQGDILDVEADVLICSANPWLNLTGGVGAELVTRYDTDVMQERLHKLLLRKTGRKYALQGETFLYQSETIPYLGVIQAVAIDAFYDSSPEIVERTIRSALEIASKLGAKTAALSALATGYGHLTLPEFARAAKRTLSADLPSIEEVRISLPDEYGVRDVCEAMELSNAGVS